jgi:hypothetical protein
MELYFITKGIKMEVDEFIKQLQGKYLPWKWTNPKTNKEENVVVQLSVRPFQLWCVGYPKEHHDLIATTILGKDYSGVYGNDGEKPCRHSHLDKFIWGLRKALHLKPLPAYTGKDAMPVRKEGVSCIALGIKDDYTMPDGTEGL